MHACGLHAYTCARKRKLSHSRLSLLKTNQYNPKLRGKLNGSRRRFYNSPSIFCFAVR